MQNQKLEIFRAEIKKTSKVAEQAASKLQIREIRNTEISADTPLGEGTIEGDDGYLYKFFSQRYQFAVRDRVRYYKQFTLDNNDQMPRRYAAKVRAVHHLLSWQTPLMYNYIY